MADGSAVTIDDAGFGVMRPSGKRFGTLVHAVLATLPLDADQSEVEELAAMHAKLFGATDEAATGPAGPLARVVREPVECAPCLLRDCPIDHRCMTRVSPERVAQAALEIAWTHAPKS